MICVASFIHQRWIRPGMGRHVAAPSVAPRDGFLALVDFDHSAVECARPLDSPAGFAWNAEDTLLYVASMFSDRLLVLDRNLTIIRSMADPSMNDLHWISFSRDRILACCSGVDSLVEYDCDGRAVWSWNATEHGYGTLQDVRVPR